MFVTYIGDLAALNKLQQTDNKKTFIKDVKKTFTKRGIAFSIGIQK